MRSLLTLMLAILVGVSAASAQEAAMELRNVEIDAQSPEGSCYQAGLGADEGERSNSRRLGRTTGSTSAATS